MARKSRKNIGTLEQPILNIAQYIRTAQYIRLSVEDSKNRGNSIENQKLIIDDYIAHNPNMKVYDTYIDNGASGMSFNRAEFQRMIDDIENGNIDCVIVKDLSRLGRNSIDTGYYIESYFAEKHIRFIAITDNFDTENLNRNDGMLLHLKNIINEAYALDIGKKIKAQARQAMREGQYVSARPRFGYLKDPADCHKLIIDPDAAPIVKQIFDWFIGGMSYNEICLQLNEKNIPTPSHYMYSKGIITNTKSVGTPYWQTRTISGMLSEPLYTGDMVQGRTETLGKRQHKIKDKSKWIVVENTHEAIVDKDLFERVQCRMEELKNNYSKKTINSYTENIWKGKIFCGECGRALHRQRHLRKKSNARYSFICLTNTRYERGGCDNTSIFEDEINAVVIAAIKAQAEVLASRKQLILYSVTDKQQLAERENELKTLKAYIEKNQNFLNSLYESLVNGIISAEEYQSMRDDYSEKISAAVQKIHDIQADSKNNKGQYDRYCDLSDSVDEIIKNDNLTKELIAKLIDKAFGKKQRY